MTNEERFAKLFRGFTGRFGRYDMKGADDSGKMAGRAQTMDRPIKAEDYADHINGRAGIGVVPLTEEFNVHFAAIDVDDYANVDHWDIAVQLKEQPLVVTYSKSGGLHIWFFSEEGVPASLAIDYMKSVAANLGFAGCEIFPKQSQRASTEDVGNWINLPYFSDTRKAVIPRKTDIGLERVDATLEQFLTVAEAAAAYGTIENLKQLTKLEANQRGVPVEADLWKDGPPCLQRLVAGLPHLKSSIERKFADGDITQEQYEKQLRKIQPKLMSGGRNETFFNVAQYLKRRTFGPGALDKGSENKLKELVSEQMLRWAERTGEPKLGQEEIDRCAIQGSKDHWNYRCNEEPLKAFCDRRTCLRRAFGVGSVDTEPDLEVSGFTIIETEPPLFAFNINDRRIVMDSEELLSQRTFRQRVLDRVHSMWPMMPEAKFSSMVDGWLKNADRVDGPPDTAETEVIRNALIEFCENRKVLKGTGKDKRIRSGGVLWSDDETRCWFLFTEFRNFLKSKGYQSDDRKLGQRLKDDFRADVRDTTMGGRENGFSVKAYTVNIEYLRQLANDEE